MPKEFPHGREQNILLQTKSYRKVVVTDKNMKLCSDSSIFFKKKQPIMQKSATKLDYVQIYKLTKHSKSLQNTIFDLFL